jgi:ubiquitin C-terminal hydrolase
MSNTNYNNNYYIKKNEKMYLNGGGNMIKNKGNFCYFTSITQCLFNCIELTDYFLSFKYKQDLHNYGMCAITYNELLTQYWESNATLIPTRLLKRISNDVYQYNDNNQEDSHECLLNILEHLHKDLDYNISVKSTNIKKNKDMELLIINYINSYKAFYKNSFSKIKEMFDGMYLSTLTCEGCDKNTFNFEPFNNITVNVDTDLYKSLSNIFSNELIEYKCDCKCKMAKKKLELWSLANNVIFHFNRFDNNSNKKKDIVEFQLLNLDLTKFLCKDNGDPNNYVYDLYGVNFHSGEKNKGHFYSACKNIDNTWIMYDDNNVSIIKQDAILHTLIHSDAYILFYRRKFIIPKALPLAE